MADRPSHIEDKTAWEIHTREARHARLQSLAASINDTARTARTSLSLFLIVALYLFLTLLSSTDENLLRNGQVELPQVGAGISLENSHIFAPLIFLSLHAQLLFLLGVLARKVRRFELALEEFPGAASPNRQREECRDWLSAFIFVQRLLLSHGVRPMSKLLVWLCVEAVPVVLLFVLDLSFVRYQSAWITWEHHIIFATDLGLLAWFNWQVFGKKFPTFRGYLKGMMGEMVRWLRALFDKRTRRSERPLRKMLWRARGAVAFCMALFMILAAHPPKFDLKTVTENRLDIWRLDLAKEILYPAVVGIGELARVKATQRLAVAEEDRDSICPEIEKFLLAARNREDRDSICLKVEKFWQAMWNKEDRDSICPRVEKFWQAVWNGGNLIDAGLCEWGLVCRYLDVRHKRLVKTQTHKISDKPGDESLATIDLSGRNLRFANFRGAHLQGAYLSGAQLQGAYLQDTQLQGADLLEARLQGAILRDPEQKKGPLLRDPQLQGADLVRAQLQGVNLRSAQLQGADLAGANLQGANLREARLQGANLARANLQGANLREAWLQCAYLQDTQLQGADLTKAQLQGSSGRPDLEYLVRASYVSREFPADKSSYLKTLVSNETATVKLAWGTFLSLEEYLKKCMEEDQE